MSHFAYLLSYVDKDQYPQLYLVLDLGVQAEKYLLTDTNIALVKLRQLNESFVKLVAQKNDISLEQYDETKSRSIELSVASLIHQITSKLNISNYTRELFYKILEVGNEAVHNPLYDDVEVARHRLQDAYDIVYVFFVWYYAPRNFTQCTLVFEDELVLSNVLPSEQATPKTNMSAEPVRPIDEQKANDWVQQGNQFRKAKNYSKAKECYSKAIQENPNHGYAIHQLGMLYKHSKEEGARNKAEALFEQAVALEHGFAYAALAEMLLDKKDNQLATRIFELLNHSLELDNPSNITYVLLSKIYEKGLLDTPKDLSKALAYAIQAQEAKYPNMDAKIARLQKLLQEQLSESTAQTQASHANDATVNTVQNQPVLLSKIQHINERLNCLQEQYHALHGMPLSIKLFDIQRLNQTDLSDNPKMDELLTRLVELTQGVSATSMSVIAAYDFVKQANHLIDDCYQLLGQNTPNTKPNLDEVQTINECFQRSKQYYQDKDYDKVTALLSPLGDNRSDDMTLLLARSYFKLGDYLTAKTHFECLMKLDVQSQLRQMAVFYLGCMYHHGYGVKQDLSCALQHYQDSQLPQAENAIKQLIDQHFDTPEVQKFLAGCRI